VSTKTKQDTQKQYKGTHLLSSRRDQEAVGPARHTREVLQALNLHERGDGQWQRGWVDCQTTSIVRILTSKI
jgi:hypothetical protein